MEICLSLSRPSRPRRVRYVPIGRFLCIGSNNWLDAVAPPSWRPARCCRKRSRPRQNRFRSSGQPYISRLPAVRGYVPCVLGGHRGIVNSHFGVVLQGAQNAEAAGHDDVAGLDTLHNFHVGRTHDAGFNLGECRTAVAYGKDALQFFLTFLLFLGGNGYIASPRLGLAAPFFSSSSRRMRTVTAWIGTVTWHVLCASRW